MITSTLNRGPGRFIYLAKRPEIVSVHMKSSWSNFNIFAILATCGQNGWADSQSLTQYLDSFSFFQELQLNSWLWINFTLLKTIRALSEALNPWGNAVPRLQQYKDLLTPVGLCLPLISIQLPWHPLSVLENTTFSAHMILSHLLIYCR